MSKNNNRRNVDGWLIINKPVGVNSTKVVAIVKRFYNAKKVGHAGTLDPLAEGVLPIALGEATKTINYSMDANKEYIFTVKWGEATSTGDAEGEVIATSDKIPTFDEINSALPYFIGKIQQTPPIYSAIKIDGKRAYDLARSGVDVQMKSRQVNIYSFEQVENSSAGRGVYPFPMFISNAYNSKESEHSEGVNTPSGKGCSKDIFSPLPNPPPQAGKGTKNRQQIASSPLDYPRIAEDNSGNDDIKNSCTFKVTCSKGTYIRSLARDLAEKLGTKGHVTMLKRTKVGNFCIDNAILLDMFDNKVYKDDSDGLLLPVEKVLDDIPVLSFTLEDAKVFKQGRIVEFDNNSFNIGDIVVVKADDKLLALGEVGSGFIKPSRVFNI